MQKHLPEIELCRTAIRVGHETPRGAAEGHLSDTLDAHPQEFTTG